MPLSEASVVIEVGPGPCGLTSAILEIICNPSRLYCIEKDIAFKELHDDFAEEYPGKVGFIYGDALEIRPNSVSENNRIVIISNLPYNVGTKLLTNWLNDLDGIDKMILMFQEEVADRICAQPGTKEYGRLSIISQLLCDVEKLFDVPKGAFHPPPKVNSTVIKMVPKNQGLGKAVKNLQRLTEICFQKRRKMIHTILRAKFREELIRDALEVCGISPTARPEEINPEQFLRMAMALGSTVCDS
jgi:16S rRNA (adenine1518-N6/adenine1519-N6)-dimethyltransferase